MDAKEFAEYKKTCKKCNRKGLPILLTRYAIAPKDSNAPEAKGDFKVTKDRSAIVSLGSDTIYTQRFLRAGYIYVYDEEFKAHNMSKSPWQGYVVNQNGYLTPFPVPRARAYVMPSPQDESTPCDPFANEMLARCISVVNPEKARTIWIGFSETAWTDVVRKNNENKAYRSRHMREFDLGKWWGSTKHDHACKIDVCDDYIVDMDKQIPPDKPYGGSFKKVFEFSLSPFSIPRYGRDWEAMAKHVGIKPSYPITNEQHQEILRKLAVNYKTDVAHQIASTGSSPKQMLQRVAARLLGEKDKEKAAVVALDDPTGVLMDLIRYMDYKLQNFIKNVIDVKYARQIKLTSIIEGMKAATESSLQGLWDARGEGPRTPGIFTSHTMQQYSHDRARAYRENPGLLRKNAKAEWKKYDEKLAPGWESWRQDYDKEAEDFDQNNILPLVKGYVEWYNGTLHSSYMECNHDSTSPKNGLHYATIASLCLGSGQDKGLINEEVIIKNLYADTGDLSMVLNRALVLNQDETAKSLQNLIENYENTTSGGWSKVREVFVTMLDVVDKSVTAFANFPDLATARRNVFGIIAAQIGDANIKLGQRAIEFGPFPRWLLRSNFINEIPTMRITIKGNIEEVANYLAKHYEEFFKAKGVSARLQRDGRFLQNFFRNHLLKLGNGTAEFTAYIAVNEERLIEGMNEEIAKSKKGKLKIANQNDAIRGSTTIVSDTVDGKQVDLKENMTVKEFEAAKEKGFVLENSKYNAQEIYRSDRFREKTSRTAKVALPAGASTMIAGLQISSLISANKELNRVMKGADNINIDDAIMVRTASLCATVDALGDAMIGLGELWPRLRNFSPILFSAESLLSKVIIKPLGILAGAFMSMMDATSAKRSLDSSQYGMAILFGISALANGVGAIAYGILSYAGGAALVAGATTVFIACIVIVVVIGIAIMLLSDDSLQKWLGRTLFGTDANQYPSLDVELKELELIAAA